MYGCQMHGGKNLKYATFSIGKEIDIILLYLNVSQK